MCLKSFLGSVRSVFQTNFQRQIPLNLFKNGLTPTLTLFKGPNKPASRLSFRFPNAFLGFANTSSDIPRPLANFTHFLSYCRIVRWNLASTSRQESKQHRKLIQNIDNRRRSKPGQPTTPQIRTNCNNDKKHKTYKDRKQHT